MANDQVEELFNWLDDTAKSIQQHQKEPYLDGLALAMEVLFYEEIPDDFDDLFTHKLQTSLQQNDFKAMNTPDVRKATELAILKGMKDSTQSQHLITPETIGLFMGYLASQLTEHLETVRIFDPASGTANLLTTVLEQVNKPFEAYASEVDPTLIQLGVNNANLQKMNVEFFHQDSLRPLLLDPVDLVISDLPVGYYPDDVIASNYELRAEAGHSYAHHLFIEQSVNYAKEGSYLIFLIPEMLFNSDQSDQLHTYIRNHAHIIGVLRLPESAFQSKKQMKSIFIIQKQGADTEAPQQPLLADLPSFNNTAAMEDILSQINAWFAAYQEDDS